MGKFFNVSTEELGSVYAEESFIADIQYDISRMLKEKKVSRSELARRMNVSAALISQMLGDDGANLTSRTIARIYFALGEEPSICAKRRLGEIASAYEAEAKAAGWMGVAASQGSAWMTEEVAGGGVSLDRSRGGHANVVWLDAVRRKAA